MLLVHGLRSNGTQDSRSWPDGCKVYKILLWKSQKPVLSSQAKAHCVLEAKSQLSDLRLGHKDPEPEPVIQMTLWLHVVFFLVVVGGELVVGQGSLARACRQVWPQRHTRKLIMTPHPALTWSCLLNTKGKARRKGP